MVSLRSLLGSLPVVLSFANGDVLEARQAARQVATARSIENIAIRSNGQMLLTNMNSGSLITVDSSTGTQSTPVSLAGAQGLSGIGEYSPDKFAVIGGNSIYNVDFTGVSPQATLIREISEANLINGLCVFNNMTVLVADGGKGNVYRFNVLTGDYDVALQDPTMAPSGGIPFGIDGITFKDGVVYYTNIFGNSFHKVSVDASAKATGAVTTLWTNLMGDDMCWGPNGKLYIATNLGNSVVEVDPAIGTPRTVAQVQGSTSCDFGKTVSDANVMYVGAGQGVFAVTIPG